MEDKQTLKLRMYINTKNTCVRHQVLWSTLPAFSKSYNGFSNNIDSINKLNEQLQDSSQGSTQNKQQLKEIMANLTMILAGALKAYASTVGNVALAKDVSISHSAIVIAKDTDADDMCLSIISKVMPLLANLADYGITQSDIDAASTSVQQFADFIGKPKSTITQIKSLNEQMAALFKDTDKILDEQLDNLMPRFKLANSVFYNEYFSARRIGGSGSGGKDEGLAT